jgi:filamentous hemagglutinin family protein
MPRSDHLRRPSCPLGVTFLSLSLLLGVALAVSQAQMTLDGSLGPQKVLTGPDYQIPAEVGQMRGGNLFHSFGEFNVHTGESATFTGPPGIENVLNRVTGGQPSHIDGLLRSEIAGANLYLLNPNGVLFGPNASLSVKGSFHVSTADFLRLGDGGMFYANLSGDSVLTMAPPSAFGFLRHHPASIAIQESALAVSPEGETLSLVGGDIEVVGGSLEAPSGQIRLVSVASAGEAVVSSVNQTPNLNVASFERLGKVDISRGARVDVSGAGAGTVVIRGGRLLVENANVFADTLGDKNGAEIGIDIEVADDVAVTNGNITTDDIGAGDAGDIRISAGSVEMSHGVIGSRAFLGTGDGGNVNITTDSLNMQEEALIETATFSEGRAGDLVVDGATVTLTDGAQISSSTFGPGQGGTVTVTASGALTLTGSSLDGTSPSGIAAQSVGQSDRAGAAGAVVIEGATVTLTDGAVISSSTFGPGPGGTVTVTASGALTLTGSSPDGALSSGIFAQAEGRDAGAGAAGAVVVEGATVTLTDGAQISSSTFGPGQGGTVTVTASGALTLTGSSPDGTFPSGIAAQAEGRNAGAGAAGAVVVEGETVTLTDGAVISSTTFGPGPGGTVTVTATDTVALTGQRSGLFTNAKGAGAGGDIVVAATAMTLTGGAAVSGSTSGSGQGGTVAVRATASVAVSGQNSGLFTTAEDRGEGGDILLEARDLRLTEGAVISAESSGTSAAGDLRLTVTDTFQSAGSAVTTEATQADGGNIELTARTMVRLRDSEITATVGGGEGAGGNITIDPEFVILQDSRIQANAVGGPGGNIAIDAGVLLADPSSRISATSARNVDGEITIQAVIADLSGDLVPLPHQLLPAAALSRNRCAAQLREGTVSSFVLRDRDGLAATPDQLLPSRLSLEAVAETGAASAEHRGQLALPPQRAWQGDKPGSPPSSRYLAGNDAAHIWKLRCRP